jgi:hypothetical protein
MDPGLVKNQDTDPGSEMNIMDFRNLKQFFGLKYLNSLMRIRNLLDTRSGIENSDPGSGIKILDLQL